jgi:subtilase family serine protease
MVLTGIASAPDASATARKRVARTAPAWVAHAHSLGRAKSAAKSTFRVYLTPNGGLDALKADVAKISDPASSTYRHFLSASAYHAKYDATGASVSKVSSWLKTNNLKVTSVESHHRYLSVNGTNASVEKAFGVSMQRFKHRGNVVQANTSEVSVPANISPLIATVSGLDSTPHLVKHQAAPPAGFRNARPCSAYYGQLKATTKADFKTPLPKFQGRTLPFAVCGYTGPQYRAAYETPNATGLDGTGTTLAVVDAYAAPTIAKDAEQYATAHGDGGYRTGQLRQVVPAGFTRQGLCGPAGWYGEETLDVEAEHAMAPGANIRYYAAKSCFDNDFLTALGRVVDQNAASLISNSWGDLEQNESTENVAAYEQIFMQGAMQGQGFLFSSGDNGDEVANSGIKQTDYPTSDPYVTSVGGTSQAIGADGSTLFQTGWGTLKYNLSGNGKSWVFNTFLYGAGGGNSSLFNQPKYQAGVVPASNGSTRAVPDVAMDADPNTGMLIGETQTFPEGAHYGEYRIGGTSLASPLFTGETALLEQNSGARLGFLNPTIYRKAKTKAFDDVKGTPPDPGNVRVDYANGLDASDGLLYSVRTFNQDSSLALAPGWDNITGVGTPNGFWITSVKPAP